MRATKSQELDEILSEFPIVRQGDPVEDVQFIRFTVELQINPADHPSPPRFFLIFVYTEFVHLGSQLGRLESALRGMIAQTSFRDAANGQDVRTSLRKGVDGVWVAVTVDGSVWEFDVKQNRWIEGPFRVA
jgi:hypothetical protein